MGREGYTIIQNCVTLWTNELSNKFNVPHCHDNINRMIVIIFGIYSAVKIQLHFITLFLITIVAEPEKKSLKCK